MTSIATMTSTRVRPLFFLRRLPFHMENTSEDRKQEDLPVQILLLHQI